MNSNNRPFRTKEKKLRIVIIALEEPFYLPRVVQAVCERRREEVVAITTVPPIFGSDTLRTTVKKYFNMLGAKECLLRGVELVAYRIIDQANSIRGKGCLNSIRTIARRLDIPHRSVRKINTPATINWLRKLAPDVIINLSGNQIFGNELLSLPRIACINIHAGPLPRYRGLFPLYWVLVNGEKRTAVTAHYMRKKVDAGGIIAQRWIDIEPRETLRSLCRKSQATAPEVVAAALKNVCKTGFRPLPNEAAEGNYFSFPCKEERLIMRERGVRFR